jgi:hypothetical protein
MLTSSLIWPDIKCGLFAVTYNTPDAEHLKGELYYYDINTGETKQREKVSVLYLGDDDYYECLPLLQHDLIPLSFVSANAHLNNLLFLT